MTENTNPQANLQQQTPPAQRNPLWGWLIALVLIVIAAIVFRVGFGPLTGTANNESDRTGNVSKVDSEASAEDTTPQNGFASGRNAPGTPATPTAAAKVYTEAQLRATLAAGIAAAVEQRENELLVPSSATIQPEPTPTIKVERVTVESGNNQGTVLSMITSTVGATTNIMGVIEHESINGWEVSRYPGATHQMRGQTGPSGPAWPAFGRLNPAACNKFPNVDNACPGFLASHGLEYGEDESQHCGTADDLCSIVVPPMSYVLMSGDFEHQLGKCISNSEIGCASMYVNVGHKSFELTGMLDNVFIIQGRYWHGDFLPEAIVAGMSHVSWNMVNGNSELNPEGIQNAGGNCSDSKGCVAGTLDQFFITSGGELLIHGATLYNR